MHRHDVNRADRLNALAKKKAAHDLKMRQEIREKKRHHIFTRKERKRAAPDETIVAYDFETTSIAEGTPTPLYITAYCDDLDYVLSRELNGIESVRKIIIDEFLIDKFNGCKFVAWNANNFDVYFIALAIMQDKRYVIRPYLTKSKSLRGLRILPIEDLELKPNQQRCWEFLDGISMLGLIGVSLQKFLETFAPEYKKQERESFETKPFDPRDQQDRDYAFRDSEGLYWGMKAADKIVRDRFNIGLRATIGNLGIRIFESRIPENIIIREPSIPALTVLRDYVCRGGYCHLMRRFRGPVWKYDLNQAYAAAMRETALPAGGCSLIKGESQYSKVAMLRVTGSNLRNVIPFYCVQQRGAKLARCTVLTTIEDTWLTSIEVAQLRSEGWKIDVLQSWVWYEAFDMADYVTALETLRQNAPGGSKGAVGTVIKNIGNNSYGKTLEQLEPLELVLAAECPPGFVDYFGQENPSQVPYVWCRLIETPSKKYHQPQLGAFITAHVRMVVRRAALLAPESFLYADTDCVIFSKDVTKALDTHESRYGAWKVEEAGTEYLLVAKKVYSSVDGKTKHSKGLRIKELEFSDFVDWFAGKIPIQKQVQRQNFVKVMKGGPMFLDRTRKGTAI